MAIEIKELHVNLHFGDANSGASVQSTEKDSQDGVLTDRESVVKDAVKEVLRILEEQKER